MSRQTPASPRVVIHKGEGRVRVDRVHSIVANRLKDGAEQYLVRWTTRSPTQYPPLSWHGVRDLDYCLDQIQDYLEEREKILTAAPLQEHPFRKRKSPDWDDLPERRPSPVDRRLNDGSRTPSVSRSSPATSSLTLSDNKASSLTSTDIYNGVMDSENGFIFARPASGKDIAELNITHVPTPAMVEVARRSKVERAVNKIRAEYIRRLERVPGKKIHLVNVFDSATPSLRFRFIPDYVLREGVYRVDPAAQVGCTSCSPHMGREIGCEYTKKCECLEYAAVDETRLDDEQKKLYRTILEKKEGSTMGLPKKFPYYSGDTKVRRTGSLVPFYLNSRRPIYECNDNCKCGPYCRNKNVQFGRMVELEIFRTGDVRGWGLRCRSDLFEGQFIDTYRGEVITDAEATRREESAGSKAKMSYLYSLDKFAESENLAQEDIYVVDGEFMGGPTKFMNHSCEPNCRQYTVSYNKHDCRVYDIAFFACQDIPAGTELTFDYLDKEEGEEMDSPGEDAIPCLCGAEKCRKWLWT